VVPQLRAVVEQLVVPGRFRLANHVEQRSAAELLVVRDQLVRLGDVSLVMLAVMILERLRRHDRCEGILGIGKFGQLEGHLRATP
jgi:hypothetical protein